MNLEGKLFSVSSPQLGINSSPLNHKELVSLNELKLILDILEADLLGLIVVLYPFSLL